MKVIKEGKIPEPKIPKFGLFYKGKCKNCSCEFEAHEDEFYEKTTEYEEISFSIYGGENWTRETALYVDCPTCKEQIKVKTANKNYGYRKALDKDVTWH